MNAELVDRIQEGPSRMRSRQLICFSLVFAVSALAAQSCFAEPPLPPPTVIVTVLTKTGMSIEGATAAANLTIKVGDTDRRFPLRSLLSFHSAEPASPTESARISAALSVLTANNDKGPKATDAACAELVEIGLPVIGPLLAAYKDTDTHEPNPLYRLFARIVPGHADALDRTLDLIRPAAGEPFRGKLMSMTFRVDTGGKVINIPTSDIRRLAVRQDSVVRTFEMQALRHCSYVGYLDAGAVLSPTSSIRADCEGFVRLSFDEDGWASDADGIKDPLPGKRRLQEGFRWGAVLGRVGPTADRWLVGKHAEKTGLGPGRLYFVINDNEHWQNNVGSYRVKLRITNAYDVGEAQ